MMYFSFFCLYVAHVLFMMMMMMVVSFRWGQLLYNNVLIK